MKCPLCGDELKPSKKDPRYVLCHNCRKKFKIPKAAESSAMEADNPPKKTTARVPAKAPAEDSSVFDDELTEQTQVFSRSDVRAALRKANEERKAEKAALKAGRKPARTSVKPNNSSMSAEEPEAEDDGEFHLRYANLPPKSVREKQEREMRKAYDELLSIGREERSSKKHGLFGKRN